MKRPKTFMQTVRNAGSPGTFEPERNSNDKTVSKGHETVENAQEELKVVHGTVMER